MEKFEAKKVSDDCIILSNSTEIEKLYSLLNKDEDFVLEWNENGVSHSELMIANNILSKVKTGDIKISSEDKK